MGLFVLPNKPEDQCSAEDFVDTAIANLKLWKENPDCDYLIATFTIPYLQNAMRKLRPINARVDKD